ncbi:hypothetical protein PVK06_004273 [Gossypium arboreum]|uniref:Uncharacterized protein n=1 Tax=Gossypium arboreum TaxID=29729 RepID=A0ABR0QRJ1_GOSAR|nr:hypothetical protein PVK06_004273 [Gossypium arboreum]
MEQLNELSMSTFQRSASNVDIMGTQRKFALKVRWGWKELVKGTYLTKQTGTDKGDNKRGNTTQGTYRPWMLVKKKSRRTGRTGRKGVENAAVGGERTSRFQVLENLDSDGSLKAREEGGAMYVERDQSSLLKLGLGRGDDLMHLDQNAQHTDGLNSRKLIGEPSWTSTTLGETINKTNPQQRILPDGNKKSLIKDPQRLGYQQLLQEGAGIVSIPQNKTGSAHTLILLSPRTGAEAHETQASITEPSPLEGIAKTSNR